MCADSTPLRSAALMAGAPAMTGPRLSKAASSMPRSKLEAEIQKHL